MYILHCIFIVHKSRRSLHIFTFVVHFTFCMLVHVHFTFTFSFSVHRSLSIVHVVDHSIPYTILSIFCIVNFALHFTRFYIFCRSFVAHSFYLHIVDLRYIPFTFLLLSFASVTFTRYIAFCRP